MRRISAVQSPVAYRGRSFPGGIVEMDAVSPYPTELVSKYQVPSGRNVSWMVTPLECGTCHRQGNPGFIGQGQCLYCQRGTN